MTGWKQVIHRLATRKLISSKYKLIDNSRKAEHVKTQRHKSKMGNWVK